MSFHVIRPSPSQTASAQVSETPTWITITIADGGYKKRVRADAIISYGTLKNTGTFVDIAGHTILVRESEADIARLVGDMDRNL